MDRKDQIILVTGATGHQGGAVARALLDAGWKVRALTRDPAAPGAQSLAHKGAEVVKGDLDDRSSLDRALKGAYGVFAVLTPFDKGMDAEIRQGKLLTDSAKAAGIKHFVYSSVSAANEKTGIPHFESKSQIEKYLKSSGIPSTILRPVSFFYNF
ncbi:MAG: NmrA/HSCARG family protein, partial [Nitrospirota bacterium]